MKETYSALTPGIGIISVCYNSMEVLPGMLASIPKGTPVVLVDNGSSTADDLNGLADSYRATLIRNGSNHGFGVACNQGAAICNAELLLFLNPDSRLQQDTLSHLRSAALAYPQASAFNPRIVDRAGRSRLKRRSILIPRSEWLPSAPPSSDRTLPVLSGAAMMVRKRDFDAIGGFDPNIFLYHEDDDLSRRLLQERGPLMFVNAAIVQHFEGRSSAPIPEIAALKGYYLARSRVYALRKHGRPFPRLGSWMVAAVQLLSPANWISSRKRAKNVAFMQGVTSAFSDGGAHSASPSLRLKTTTG